MTIKTFEDIIAWQKAKHLYSLLVKEMADCKTYAYKDQLLRAGLSISNNIAEGFDRSSDKELRQFLVIARGSAAEVRSMVLIGQEHGYIKHAEPCLLLDKDISNCSPALFNRSVLTDDGRRMTDNF